MLSKREIPTFIDRAALSSQLKAILDISAKGLDRRGKNEKHFLEPLYERAERLTNPAKQMVAGIESGILLRIIHVRNMIYSRLTGLKRRMKNG
jgi:hypothetical protein